MKFIDKISMCFGNLYKRKVRTLLTTIGVIVGTCAIVITVSLGIGMQMATEESLASMGDLTMIQIYGYGISADRTQLDEDMLEQLKSNEHVVAVMPSINAEWGSMIIQSGKYIYEGSLNGVIMEDLEAMGYTLKEGEWPEVFEKNMFLFGSNSLYDFYDSKKNTNNRVSNFSGKDPFVSLDDKFELRIKIPEDSKKKQPVYKMTPIGVMEENWNLQPSSSYSIFIDYNAMKDWVKEYKKLNNIKVEKNEKLKFDMVSVKCDDMENVAEVEEWIQSFGFDTYSMESIRKPLQDKARQEQLTLGSLGAISLLVAAIGITNTMIMSIYERTREIGVMKVLGCKISDIRQVFLMEAASIGFMGGLFGIIISEIISFGINHFGGGVTGESWEIINGMAAGSTSVIPWWLVVMALVFATLIGLVSGIAPANRAVKISALTAIKQDT